MIRTVSQTQKAANAIPKIDMAISMPPILPRSAVVGQFD